MADAYKVIRYGSADTVIVTLTPLSGTLTAASQPTVGIKDTSGNVVLASTTPVTAYDPGAQAAPTASYRVVPAVLWASEDLAVAGGGTYILTFYESLTNGETEVTSIVLIIVRNAS